MDLMRLANRSLRMNDGWTRILGEKINALAKANSKLPDNEHAILERIWTSKGNIRTAK
jgi:hypothetical protein